MYWKVLIITRSRIKENDTKVKFELFAVKDRLVI